MTRVLFPFGIVSITHKRTFSLIAPQRELPPFSFEPGSTPSALSGRIGPSQISGLCLPE